MFDKFNKLVKILLEQIISNKSENKITEIPCRYEYKIRNKIDNKFEIKVVNISDHFESNHSLNRYLERATQKDKSKQKFYHFIQLAIKEYLTNNINRRFRIKIKHETKFYIQSESNKSFKIEIGIRPLNKNEYNMILYTTLERNMISKFGNEMELSIENKNLPEQIYNIIID